MTGRPDCSCHGEAMYWQKDKRLRAGGRWICGAVRRAQSAARYAVVSDETRARWRQRYDTDPVFRIEKLMADARRRRLTNQKARTKPSEALVNYLRRHRGTVSL